MALIRSLLVAAPVLPMLLVSCVSTGNKSVSPHQFSDAAQVEFALRTGPGKLEAIASQLDGMLEDFESYSRQRKAGWTRRGYMKAAENERMELLMFRFVSAQDSLSDMVGSLGGRHSNRLFPEERMETAAHVLVTDAQFLMMGSRADLVALFADDPVAISKLNEAFYRDRIPKGTYERFRLSVTDPDLPPRLKASWDLFEHDSRRISDLREREPEYGQLLRRLPSDYLQAMASVQRVNRGGFEETLVHTRAATLVREARGGMGDTAYKGRRLLFKFVSRIKNPTVKVISFSDAQHDEVKRLLQPGDIVVTYTAGYMSDVFIPGSFKHGITYIGTPAQRKAAGLDAASIPKAAGRESRTVAAEFDRANLPNGRQADVIEAVAEGVIFNNLGFLMDTHVNRMAVLRPKLNRNDRARFLAEVFSYHGDEYDFMFDFADASRQVCTEVIWRGINGRAGIDLGLTKRGGHPTLSADDLVNYHFQTGGRHFDFVLFAEGARAESGGPAVIHTGKAGEEKLRRQMSQ